MIKKIGIAVAILAIVVALVYRFYILKPVPNVQNQKADFVLTYDQLAKEINANDTATDAKYDGKLIEISGLIKSINLSDTAISSITIGDTSADSDISLIITVPPKNYETIKNLAFGTNVTMRANYTGMENTRVKPGAAKPSDGLSEAMDLLDGGGEEEGTEDVQTGSISLQFKDGAAIIKKQ